MGTWKTTQKETEKICIRHVAAQNLQHNLCNTEPGNHTSWDHVYTPSTSNGGLLVRPGTSSIEPTAPLQGHSTRCSPFSGRWSARSRWAPMHQGRRAAVQGTMSRYEARRACSWPGQPTAVQCEHFSKLTRRAVNNLFKRVLLGMQRAGVGEEAACNKYLNLTSKWTSPAECRAARQLASSNV